jgi:ribose 5-phosphate isomerase B
MCVILHFPFFIRKGILPYNDNFTGGNGMIAIASDHAGFELKQDIIKLLDELKLPYHDYGAYSMESCDYAFYASYAAKAVQSGECGRGILICGTGIGMSIAANKVPGIRCAACSEPFSALFSRKHNDSNMLALGARIIGAGLARLIVETWLDGEFEGGRHQRRIDQIRDLENGAATPRLC